MCRARFFLVTIVLLGVTSVGVALAGQWPYVMMFYDDTGNAVGWQIGACNGSVHYSGQRTDTYNIAFALQGLIHDLLSFGAGPA